MIQICIRGMLCISCEGLNWGIRNEHRQDLGYRNIDRLPRSLRRVSSKKMNVEDEIIHHPQGRVDEL